MRFNGINFCTFAAKKTKHKDLSIKHISSNRHSHLFFAIPRSHHFGGNLYKVGKHADTFNHSAQKDSKPPCKRAIIPFKQAENGSTTPKHKQIVIFVL